MKKLTMRLVLLLMFLGATNASAVMVDFYDNALPPQGVYGLLYGNYYHADQFTDGDGHKAVSADLTASIAIARVVGYKTLGNIPFAFQAILPFGELKETKLFKESSSGIGDLAFGPAVFLYHNDDTRTYLSYWFYVMAPTGEWDKGQSINLGGHHWYFEHQLALNKQFGSLVYDMNLNYYQHSEESDTKTSNPDRIEVEASMGYQLTEKLTLGLNGGFYRDLGKIKVQGDKVADSQAERWQIGPSLGYMFNDRLGLNLRWTHDIKAINDSRGDDLWLRLGYSF